MKLIKNLLTIIFVITPFNCMPSFGKKKLTKLHMIDGEFFQARTNCDKRMATVLMDAAFHGDKELAEAALEMYKSDKKYIDQQDKETGNTALHVAASFGALPFIRLLVDAGADITIANIAGETARKIAQKDGFTDCAIYLQANEEELQKQKEDKKRKKAADKKKKQRAKKKQTDSEKKQEQESQAQTKRLLPLDLPPLPEQLDIAAREVDVPSPRNVDVPLAEVDVPSPRHAVDMQELADMPLLPPAARAQATNPEDEREEDFPGMPSNPPSPDSQTMPLKHSFDEKQIAEINEEINHESLIIAPQDGKIFFRNQEVKDGDPIIRSLIVAISRQDMEKIDALIKLIQEKGLDINTALAGILTPLQFAVVKENPIKANPIMVKKLVAAGAFYYKSSANFMNPLQMAAQTGRSDIGEILLSKNPLIKEVVIAAASIAAEKGNFDFIVMMLRRGGDLDGQTILHYAAYNGNLPAVKKYVTYQNINIADKDGQTALDYAAAKHYWDIVEFLMSIHASTQGNTLLHYACAYGDIDKVEELLEKQDVEVDKLNAKGQTPLLCTLDSQFRAAALKLVIARLVKAGASLFARDPEGNWNILELTACYLEIDLLQFLISLFKEVTTQDKAAKLKILKKAQQKVGSWILNSQCMNDVAQGHNNLTREEVMQRTFTVKRMLEQEIARISKLSSKSSPEADDNKEKQEPKNKKAKPKISQAERDEQRAAINAQKRKDKEAGRKKLEEEEQRLRTQEIQERQLLEKAKNHYKEKMQRRALEKLKKPLIVNKKLRSMAPAFAVCKAKADKQVVQDSFNAWKVAFKARKDKKAQQILARKEAEKLRIINVQQKIFNYWKQLVAYKKNKRQILETLKPTDQELSSMLIAVVQFELINARHKLASYEKELTDMFTPEAQKMDKAEWQKQWDELDAKIKFLQKYIDTIEIQCGITKKSRFTFAQ